MQAGPNNGEPVRNEEGQMDVVRTSHTAHEEEGNCIPVRGRDVTMTLRG
jgi:hypothetical protein